MENDKQPNEIVNASGIEHILITDADSREVILNRRFQQANPNPDEMLPRMEGHVLIKDADTGEVVLDKKNAIHLENMSEALALSLSHQGYGHIHKMVFGNGASTVSGTGAVTYFPPNVSGAEATLYNMTYSDKIVDGNSPQNTDPARNYMEVSHVATQTYTDIIVHCYLDYSEPVGQDSFDDSTDTEGLFIFDEMGLVGYPSGTATGRLLTHCVFNPVQKSLNRAFEIEYTIRIFMAQ
jgi:hypothetical protein